MIGTDGPLQERVGKFAEQKIWREIAVPVFDAEIPKEPQRARRCPAKPAILQFFNMTLRWEQKYSRRRVRSGSYLAHLDRPPACVATEGPEHRCFDRRYPRELG